MLLRSRSADYSTAEFHLRSSQFYQMPYFHHRNRQGTHRHVRRHHL